MEMLSNEAKIDLEAHGAEARAWDDLTGREKDVFLAGMKHAQILVSKGLGLFGGLHIDPYPGKLQNSSDRLRLHLWRPRGITDWRITPSYRMPMLRPQRLR
jgi:hypothetical protein